MTRLLTLALAAVAASGFAFAAEARLADENGDGLSDRDTRFHRLDLTEEQRAELRATVSGLRENGASRTEIVTAVGDKLEDLGVELPEDFEERQAERLDRATLRDELRGKVDALRESGATREEIRTEVDAFKEANGLEGGHGKRSRGKGHGKAGLRGRRGSAPTE